MRNTFVFILCLLASYIGFSQGTTPGGNRPAGSSGNRQIPTGTMYGKIIETKTGKPIEYASVELVQNKFDSVSKKRKDVTITGMITKANGDFSLENVPLFGQMKLKVTIVGFKPYEQAVSFDLKRPANGDMSAMLSAIDKDLGNIKVDVEEKELSNVTVTASTSALKLGIDRKIFNVDKNLVSAGGTAVDVMKNIPSVNVDLDGNVTMRNNAPQIFVDGRPTTMTLDQIPADVIESVEIITNPSAKFVASGGTAGILNVVLKKNKKVGYNGGTRFNVDSRGRIGLGGDINLRQQKVNLFLNANYNQRKSISNGTTDRTTFINPLPDTVLHQLDKSVSDGHFMFFRGGADFFITNRNTLSIAGNIGSGTFKPITTSNIYVDSLNAPFLSSLTNRVSTNKSKMENKGVQLSFKHNFPKNGMEWTADATYNKSNSRSENTITNESFKLPSTNTLGNFKQQQNGIGSFDNLVLQSDYVNPINDKSKIEMGVRASIRKVESKNDFYFFDMNGSAVFNPLLSINYNSTDKVYAAYTTYSNQVKNFGYQLGVRVESSNYSGNLPEKGQSFNIKFPVSFFPSIFLSDKMKNDQELQLNYTRKINRPNFFQLYPFTDYSDSLNISRGNPDLKPEFTNSVELSYQKTFKKNKDNLLASIYYKNTTDLITRYQVKEFNEVSNKDVLVNTYINANSSYVTGLELTLKVKMAKWWDMTPNMNLFTSKINTGIAGVPEQDQFVSWFGKLNNQFKLFKNFTMQLSGEYQSKTILPPGGSGGGGGRGGPFGGGGGMGGFGQATSSQGYVRSNYFVDAGFRYEFLKSKQASVSLNINDIFRTRRSDIHSEDLYFTQDVFRRRDPQILRLNFSWRFGKFDPNLFKRKNMKNQNEGMDNMNMGQ